MNIKDIKKQLEKLEDNEDKLEYLNKLLEQVEDEKLKEFIKSLIKDIESLESKLEKLPDLTPIRRQVELDEVEHDIESREVQITPQRSIARPDLMMMPREQENIETNYAPGNYSINLVPEYLTQTITTYESFATEGAEISKIEQNLVRENILNPESPLSELTREQLHVRVRELMPFASPEEVIRYEANIITGLRDTKKAERLKYIPKVR